jgi:Family of unknown function (DUF6252)
MKKLSLAILMIGLVFLGSSCKKDSNGNTIYKMSAKIDGKDWSALAPFADLHSGIFTLTGTSLTSSETIIIVINGETQKTYEFSPITLKAECLGTYKATITAPTIETYVSTTGKVTLTKVDKTNSLVSGTFEFTVANSALTAKQITVGAFNDVTFITQ